MKKLILTMVAIAIVSCSPPTSTPQQACAYYEANSCDKKTYTQDYSSWPIVGWYCSNVRSMCEDYKYNENQRIIKEQSTLIANQLNTDQVLRSIVQQSINHGVKCNEEPDSAYCLAIDMRSKQLISVVTISSTEYQQMLININAQTNESIARIRANKEALEILKKAENGK